MTFKILNRQTYNCYNKFAKGIREKNMMSGEGGERLAWEHLWVQIPFLYLSFLRAVIPWDLLFLSAFPPPPTFPFSFRAIFFPKQRACSQVPCEIFHSVWNSFPLPSPPRNSPRKDIPIGVLPWGTPYFVTKHHASLSNFSRIFSSPPFKQLPKWWIW